MSSGSHSLWGSQKQARCVQSWCACRINSKNCWRHNSGTFSVNVLMCLALQDENINRSGMPWCKTKGKKREQRENTNTTTALKQHSKMKDVTNCKLFKFVTVISICRQNAMYQCLHKHFDYKYHLKLTSWLAKWLYITSEKNPK